METASFCFTASYRKILWYRIHGQVVELVDTLALGASAARREGSSPFIPTNLIQAPEGAFLFTV